MPRVTNAPASRRRRRRVLKQARGFRGSRSKLFRQATEAVDRAMCLATRHRKSRKREFRSLWIVRISAACRATGVSYSRFMKGVNKAGIGLNRKVLADIAVKDQAAFTEIARTAKSAA